MISNIFTELGHVSIVIFTGVCILSFIKINYNLINGSSSGFGSIWSRSILNVIFILLRCISAFKLVIAILRGLIKARKFTKFQNKAITDNTRSKSVETSIEKLNNKCIICLDELYDYNENPTDFENKEKLVLGCKHIFHLDCFKQWYVTSENCPYCREKVEI